MRPYQNISIKTPTLLSYLAKQQNLYPFHEDVYKNNRIEIVKDKDRPEGMFAKLNYGGPFDELIGEAANLGVAALTEIYLSARMIYLGPKVYRPRTEDCFAMEAIRPQVTFEEYQQPFDLFTIEFPEAYRKARKVGDAHPLAVSIYKHPALLLSSVLWDNGFSTVNSFGPISDTETVEQMLCRAHGKVWDDSLEYTEAEQDFTEAAIRLGINACMLLTHYGCKKVGYVNPEHAGRLERRLLKKTKAAIHEQNERELRCQPVLYTFNQEVKLYDTAEENDERSESASSGSPRRAHWRRGFWRMQVCGTGRLERKRIFIKPVLVNAKGIVEGVSVLYRH